MRKIRFCAFVPLAFAIAILTASRGINALGAVIMPVVAPPTASQTVSPLPSPSPVAAVAPLFFGFEAQGIGDPNPYYEKGRYYVFYLQNEGRHPWRMSSSTDLSNWSAPVDAVPVGQAGEADYWTGSGSIVANRAGGYRIFYTGHLPGGAPQEIVMSSRAGSLPGPWSKTATPRLGGAADYGSLDFRDPFVFWNQEANAYWLLITTRKNGQAVVGRYASSDLDHWTVAPPLYTEISPLNLEVPDFFQERRSWFLLFSDQRGSSRQTRYLRSTTATGPFTYGVFDALDGRGFYAGKTAGQGAHRLLFGWVASRRDKRDDTELVWGGDLVAHAIRHTDNGVLAVDIAQPLAEQFVNTVKQLSLAAPAANAIGEATRMTADLSIHPGDKFGIRFARDGLTDAVAQIDTTSGIANFIVGRRTTDVPQVAFPISAHGQYHLDLLLDPRQGFGILYINHFRALSFRYYGLNGKVPALYAAGGLISLDGDVRTRCRSGTRNSNINLFSLYFRRHFSRIKTH